MIQAYLKLKANAGTESPPNAATSIWEEFWDRIHKNQEHDKHYIISYFSPEMKCSSNQLWPTETLGRTPSLEVDGPQLANLRSARQLPTLTNPSSTTPKSYQDVAGSLIPADQPLSGSHEYSHTTGNPPNVMGYNPPQNDTAITHTRLNDKLFRENLASPQSTIIDRGRSFPPAKDSTLKQTNMKIDEASRGDMRECHTSSSRPRFNPSHSGSSKNGSEARNPGERDTSINWSSSAHPSDTSKISSSRSNTGSSQSTSTSQLPAKATPRSSDQLSNKGLPVTGQLPQAVKESNPRAHNTVSGPSSSLPKAVADEAGDNSSTKKKRKLLGRSKEGPSHGDNDGPDYVPGPLERISWRQKGWITRKVVNPLREAFTGEMQEDWVAEETNM